MSADEEQSPPDETAVVTADVTAGPPPWLLRAFLMAAATVAGLVCGFWILQKLRPYRRRYHGGLRTLSALVSTDGGI